MSLTLKARRPTADFTSPSLPILTSVDEIEAKGSLMLIDATHPRGAWPAGVPADTSTLPNVLWVKALAAIGAGSQAALAANYVRTGLADATKGFIERTTKGGLHVTLRQDLATTSADSVTVAIPAGVLTYMRANTAHQFYISMWHQITKTANPLTTNFPVFQSIGTIGAHNANTTSMSNGGPGGAIAGYESGTFANGSSLSAANLLGPHLRAGLGATSYFGAAPYDQDQYDVFCAANGCLTNKGANFLGRNASHILYRAYFEDLTVSGRGFADVFAIDQRAYTREVLSVGGRYYADTFTAPA